MWSANVLLHPRTSHLLTRRGNSAIKACDTLLQQTGGTDMSEDAKQLVAQLQDFWKRKDAEAALRNIGQPAVPHLIEALGSPDPNARSCVRNILGKIRGEAVVRALIDVLDDPKRQSDAAEVLRQVTGQSIPADREAWEAWAHPERKPPVPPPPPKPAAPAPPEPAARPAPPKVPKAPPKPAPAPKPTSDEALVAEAVAGTGIQVEQRSGGLVLTVPLPGRRHQSVTVSFAAKDFEDEPLVVVYTECGPAAPAGYEWALRQNLRLSFGAIALRDRDGQPLFVMVDTHLRKTVSPADIRKSVLLLAEKGDALEEALTKADQH